MTPTLLSDINHPDDLKCLSLDELKAVAQELRDLIVETVAANGGHLASNLGVIELTLALHTVYDVVKDRIVWDVGHQCYAHKILTGRRDVFHTLRTEEGISGFPKPSESETDAFGTGHSSTSISAALGLAWARDLSKQDQRIIAVIGDGSIPGGMAFEGMNNAGHFKTDILIVLNDNEMSISPTVGALSAYFSRFITDPRYNWIKDEVRDLVSRVPSWGDALVHMSGHVEESLKNLLVPGGLFEEFGIRYFGPIDGHDLGLLIHTLKDIKAASGPRILHILTKKGRGFSPAERNPEDFHGSNPFVLVKKGDHTNEWFCEEKSPAKSLTYTAVFSQALLSIAEKDPKVVAVTAAMPAGTGLSAFQSRFPGRFFDVGIAEQHAITFAAGLAQGGLKPVVAIYSTFLQRAFDQIVHDVCIQELPVGLILDRSGLVGEDGPTHHGIFDIAYLANVPSMICMSPKDENELQHMLCSALTWNKPFAIRYPKATVEGVSLETPRPCIGLGEAERLLQGQDVALLAYGCMVPVALKAAEILRQGSLDPCVVNLRFASPLDEEMMAEMGSRFPLLVTLEEHSLSGGVGSRVVSCLADRGISVPVLRLGLCPGFPAQGKRASLLKAAGLDAEGIALSVQTRLNEMSKRRK